MADYFIKLTKKDMEQWMIHLPDQILAYFPEGTEHFDDYVEAVGWAQEYAFQNRQSMVDLVLAALARHLHPFEVTSEVVNCHQLRRSRAPLRRGRLGHPQGRHPRPRRRPRDHSRQHGRAQLHRPRKGNPESFCSSAYGAGRRMSWTAAGKKFTEDDMKKQTEGVICRKDKGVIDEIPGAYKDIDTVMENQSDLTEFPSA